MPQIVNKKSVLDMAMGAIAEITDYETCEGCCFAKEIEEG